MRAWGLAVSDGEITLYFGLKEGQRADLEVVAAAALEWVESVRAAARVISPEAQVRIEIVSAEESSLRLNTIFEWIEAQLTRVDEGTAKYKRLRKLAIALAVFVPTVGVPTYHFYFVDPPKAELTEQDRELLNKLLEKTREDPAVKEKRQKFFKMLERDTSISSAGVSEGRSDPPLITIPSDRFAELGGLWAILDEDKQERTTYPVVDVVLISPVLLPFPRVWKFQPPGLPEFSANMLDKTFLMALKEDHVRERLRVGIPMTVRLAVKEKKVSGVWVQKRGGRSVVEVISPKVN
jgi:hypothetical protein